MPTVPPGSVDGAAAPAAPMQSARSVLVDLSLVASIVLLAKWHVDAREAWYLLGIMVMARFSIGASKLYLYRANSTLGGARPGASDGPIGPTGPN